METLPEPLASILGTFLGALLGIPAGIAVNHAWQKRTDNERRRQLRASLKSTVEANTNWLDQILAWVNKSGYPFFNVDLTVLESTAALKYEFLDDIPLCGEIDRLHFELIHFARKVDLLLSLQFNPQAHLTISGPHGNMLNELRPGLVKSLNDQAPAVKKFLAELAPKLT